MKKYILDNQETLFGANEVIGFGDERYYVKEIPKKASNKIIIENHYSKKTATDAHTKISLGIFLDDNIVGALQLGYAMNPRSMDKIVTGTQIDEYLELNRMWIDDKAGKNSESKAVSYAIKFIKRKYPKVKWIQSFADERCNKLGIVYQACNFDYCGYHLTDFWEYNGEFFHKVILENNNRKKAGELKRSDFYKKAKKHSLRQFRYIFFIKKKEKKNLCFKLKKYPKHYNND